MADTHMNSQRLTICTRSAHVQARWDGVLALRSGNKRPTTKKLSATDTWRERENHLLSVSLKSAYQPHSSACPVPRCSWSTQKRTPCFVFVSVCFILFIHFCLTHFIFVLIFFLSFVCILYRKRERKSMKVGGRVGGEDLKGVVEGKNMVKMYEK